MASKFFIVHHAFKPGMAEKWWEHMQNYDDDKQIIHLENQSKAGVYCHTFMPINKERSMFCIWEAKEEVSDTEFQNFFDCLDAIGVNMRLDHPLNNHCQKIDHDLIGGNSPYPRKF